MNISQKLYRHCASNTGGVEAIEYVYYGTQEQWDELPKGRYEYNVTVLG